jgi:hypothetical protein
MLRAVAQGRTADDKPACRRDAEGRAVVLRFERKDAETIFD